ITLEKGKIFSVQGDNFECRDTEDSDEISGLIGKGTDKYQEKRILIESVESKKTFNITLKNNIIRMRTPTDSVEQFKTLIFQNDSSVIGINGNFIKGDIEIRLVSGTFKIINIVDVEEYLRHSISKEMNPGWPLEALKAQAVLARTYVLKKKYYSRNCLYDIGSTTIDQVYGTFSEDSLDIIQAVSGTSGEVLKYRGEIIDALYHSCCGGKTAGSGGIFGAEKPYLTEVDCSCRGECPFGKGWRYVVSSERIRKIFGLKKLEKISEDGGKIKISGDKNVVLSKNSFREKIGFGELKSSNFTFKFTDGEMKITGRGFGHGVGLCQYGAKRMAEEGKNYIEILKHYFKDVTIEKIY
ncbi:MAG: SpoIID/LytB domain-containing protein, partial [Deltaproteobacteria bacterium]|nr:SpoIID/LytB domain-containing protein [Deltaproteobacteria bacterium]